MMIAIPGIGLLRQTHINYQQSPFTSIHLAIAPRSVPMTAMELGICSFSFHRLLAAGKQDIARYIQDCRELGCTQLDPWNAHLSPLKQASAELSPADEEYMARIEEFADASGLPWGTLAVDGAHIYEPAEEARRANRAAAYRWIEIAAKLGFEQVRIDAGGPEEMPDDVFAIIVDGYNDVIARAKAAGVALLMENHRGPSTIPDNVVKLCESIEGLGLLYDTHNWKPERREEGRRKCAKYAQACHIKTFSFDAAGNENSGAKPEEAIQILLDNGYKGTWGIESVPSDGDEYAGARRTVDLIRKYVS
jgi:sugar phosphate isomerase/epimerase